METDRRTKRTKKLLTNAFSELLLEKPLNEITVKELCQKADINRGTFYLHYQDIYDFKQQLEDEIYQYLNTILDSHSNIINEEITFNIFLDLFHFAEKNEPLLRAFLGANCDISFLKKTQTLFKERYLSILLQDTNVGNLFHIDYSYNFLASGFTGLMETWLNKEPSLSAEKMAKLSTTMIFNGLLSLLERNK